MTGHFVGLGFGQPCPDPNDSIRRNRYNLKKLNVTHPSDRYYIFYFLLYKLLLI